MTHKSEFVVEDAFSPNHSGSIRWVWSHVWRHKLLLIGTAAFFLLAWGFSAYSQVLIGQAAGEILEPTVENGILLIGLAVLGVLFFAGVCDLLGNLAIETVAQRLGRDAREELYISLLAKSQTFHDRQRVGDIMARATDDINYLIIMISPGVFFIFEVILGLTIPVLFIATINIELIAIPLLFIVVYVLSVRWYAGKLLPVTRDQRMAYGAMNAGLEETISGIEVVKASAQEPFERKKFYKNARAYRDYFAAQGRVEAQYVPVLFYGFVVAIVFLHTMLLLQRGDITIPGIIAVMGLIARLRFPVFVSIFSTSLIQLGVASAERILDIIVAKADLDENAEGHTADVQGDIVFEHVTFGFENGNILEDISFHVQPGETVAIVGQTGSGKTTLTELINRTYDATEGRILVDGVDVREWTLTSLRSQISKIEQDVFLFSRTIAENIAFGAPDATQAQIEQAAKEAQAHDFIMAFQDGYDTKVGSRGVTLSGGQRQRLALARAFLSNPRILILDDSTSAIDSATEDEIQKAIRRAQEGRTTLLITHRLSQIRWADHILVLEGGKLIAAGSHDDLLRTSDLYRRIFSRYDAALPPLEPTRGKQAV